MRRYRPYPLGVILFDAISISMSRPDRPLFSDISLTMSTGDRMGLVGINGTGKSTLLRVLAGRQDPEGGELRPGRDVRVSMLDQDAPLPSGKVLDAVVASATGRAETWEAEAALTRLGLGDFFDRDTAELSGGEAKRVGLARALVAPSDLLILDEPTNHLDLDGILWLEQHLADYRGGLLLVTHDRHVLDRVVNRMLELDRGSAHIHDGNYDSYLLAVSERAEAAASADAIRRNLAKSELAWLRRGAKARSSKPKYRVEAAKALIAEKSEGPARPAELHLEFPTPRLGDVVIELDGLGATTPDGRQLFAEVELKLDPRERLGIVGPNGAGKSTLLNLMARRVEPKVGDVNWGTTVSLGYFSQTGEELDPQLRARQVVAGPNREPDWTDARLLESFWFDKDSQWAEVGTLSGGERRRLQLLQVLASKPNVLLLDEPTNDLDLETLRSLEDFLEDWPGAVVVVSHDRAFLERVVADALIIDAGRAFRYPGGYNAWDEARKAGDKPAGSVKQTSATTKPKSAKKPSKQSSGRSSSTLGHLIRAAEKKIAKLEKKKTELTDGMAAAGSDHETLSALGAELAEVEVGLAALEEEWLELSEEREG